jgi:hypothetical protein
MKNPTRRLTLAALAALVLAATPGASDAIATSVPGALRGPLAARDPLAFADTTLPRVSALSAAARAELARELASWPVDHRVAAWAFLHVGVPYRLGPLGEEAPPDPDPLIAFEASDCAVLNLVSAALAHVDSATDERAAMARANYRDGRIAYANRLHFTTDRLDASPYYRDITRRAGGKATRVRRVELNRKANGEHWIAIDWTRPREVEWLPRDLGPRFAAWHDAGRLPDAVGVAFVQASKLADGLDVVHESLLWKGRTLLHASSATGRVVTMPWIEFLAGPGRRYDGFVLFEYR